MPPQEASEPEIRYGRPYNSKHYAITFRTIEEGLVHRTMHHEGEIFCWLNGKPVYIPYQETPPRLYACVVDILRVLEAMHGELR